MADYTDLKKRLRELASWPRFGNEFGSILVGKVSEAADAIEALEKERDAYEGWYKDEIVWNAALEEAAKVAERFGSEGWQGKHLAAAIRELKR